MRILHTANIYKESEDLCVCGTLFKLSTSKRISNVVRKDLTISVMLSILIFHRPFFR